MPNPNYSKQIKEKARELGFFSCGIAQAGFLEEEAAPLEQWLKNGLHGQMGYMGRNFDKRLDPRKLVPGAKSVVSVLMNYHTEKEQPPGVPKISKYGYGIDYHFVMKDKLRQLFDFVGSLAGDVQGRAFVDTAPVLDRAWAKRAGLGWVGKNTQLITRGQGSYFFIGELVIDLELEPDAPHVQEYCGTCTRCVDACPTGALATPYILDANRCISYLTIELREAIPERFQGQMENYIFGCDICQQVCPWNRRAVPHNEPNFEPHPDLLGMSRDDWEEITQETYRRVFKKSAVKRTKLSGLRRNIEFLHPRKGNSTETKPWQI